MLSRIARCGWGCQVRRQNSRSMFVRQMSLSVKDLNPALFKQQSYSNGQWIDGNQGAEKIPVFNPANGEAIGVVPNLGALDAAAAVEHADTAYRMWKRETAAKRGKILQRWGELMVEQQDDLARILTLEQGKPLAEARVEILYAAGFLEFYASEAVRVLGSVHQPYDVNTRIVSTREPLGVCVGITPWNFPSAMITRKAGPALAAGNSIIIKPSEFTPYSALALCQLAEDAGVPGGVFSVLTGDPVAIGNELCANAKVKKLSFTGSTRVGKMLMAQCAETVKRTSMELGGNAPFVVFEDADLDLAVSKLLLCKFRNAGQTCVSANRILVHADVYDAFHDKLEIAMQRELTVGDGFGEGVTVGPLINSAAVDKVRTIMADAQDKGATLSVPTQSQPEQGTFCMPTIIRDATTTMDCFTQEIFGPVVPMFRFHSDEEAAEMANCEFGLAAYFFTSSASRIWHFTEALEYGMVGVNHNSVSHPSTPFGGIKESGLGREGSSLGIDEYTAWKTMHQLI